jgi:hypothetical protein
VLSARRELSISRALSLLLGIVLFRLFCKLINGFIDVSSPLSLDSSELESDGYTIGEGSGVILNVQPFLFLFMYS